MESDFDLLTTMKHTVKFDFKTLQNQVEEVIRTSQHFHNLDMNIDELMNDWLRAKYRFIEKLNGNLIYEVEEPVTFHLNDESKTQRLHEFADYVYIHYNNQFLSAFLYDLNVEDFYNNKTSKDYQFPYSRVPKNTKVIKAFKYFIRDEELLNKIQYQASQIIQENCIHGKLCLSVHPLDFLSASENTHNWRSCHALDGEYRSGNLNYLMDSATVICYLKSAEPAHLPHFPQDLLWNSKKWRVWLYFSNDDNMLFFGRQYPFSSEVGLKYVLEEVLPKINLGKWDSLYESKVNFLKETRTGETFYFRNFVPVGNTLKPLNELVVNGKHTFHYNDVLNSSCYNALYTYRNRYDYLFDNKTRETNSLTVFVLGRKCRCPLCGKEYIDRANIMACDDCIYTYGLDCDDDEYEHCDICGMEITDDEVHYTDLTGAPLCTSCAESSTVECCQCGIIDFPEEMKFNGEDQKFYCPHCYNELHKDDD
jgi:hypothetical protein